MFVVIGFGALVAWSYLGKVVQVHGVESTFAKPSGSYCLVKPGGSRLHCEGVTDSPRDSVLAAIITLNQQEAAEGMNQELP